MGDLHKRLWGSAHRDRGPVACKRKLAGPAHGCGGRDRRLVAADRDLWPADRDPVVRLIRAHSGTGRQEPCGATRAHGSAKNLGGGAHGGTGDLRTGTWGNLAKKNRGPKKTGTNPTKKIRPPSQGKQACFFWLAVKQQTRKQTQRVLCL